MYRYKDKIISLAWLGDVTFRVISPLDVPPQSLADLLTLIWTAKKPLHGQR